MNTNNISNDQQYLEMSAQLKESYDKFENEKNELRAQNLDMKKDLMAIYGLARALDIYYSDYVSDDNNTIMEYLIESLRSSLSGSIDAHILDDE